MAYTIICKNCDTLSVNDWEGFCSISCCCDYAHRHNISIERAKRPDYDDHLFMEGHPCSGDDPRECKLEELERWYDDALEANERLEEDNENLKDAIVDTREEMADLQEDMVNLKAIIKEWNTYTDRFALLDL